MLTFDTYVKNSLVKQNQYLTMPRDDALPPTFEAARDKLPRPIWAGHQTELDCYWRTWQLAFKNLRRPTAENGFVANFIDTAFNDNLFMWDSAFILLFGRYGSRAFNFQRTLDNFYAKQHPDGFICREIKESDGEDFFERFDPASTGPNVMPWTEWEYYLNFGDRERLAQVFPPLVAYHRWLKTYRTWPDGAYWACGLACGMDNQPRLPAEYDANFSHGHYTWVDTCLQQILSARLLVKMSQILGRQAEVQDLQAEADRLTGLANTRWWDGASAFYYDCNPSGELSGVMSIGAYWALLAGVVPPERLEPFIAHLQNPAEFNRPHRIPALAANHPRYNAETGNYWCGGVWSPTNYMVLRGLTRAGYDALAHEIGLNHLQNVVQTFTQTGTLWENYAPEKAAPGKPARPDFVGWTGLPPITILFEYVFGLRPDVSHNRLVWDVRLLDEHGVSRYPFGNEGLLDLHCASRQQETEESVIQASSTTPVELVVQWAGGSRTILLHPSRN